MDESRKILVIDDEEIVHASIKRILSRMGHEVEGALTAQEGLEKLRHAQFDAVIADLMMPEMNGIEMLHAMREQQINVPTIMVTGYPTIKTAIQALRLGAVDYIPKPFTRQEIISPLSRALHRSAEQAKEAGEQGKKGVPGDAASAPTPDDCYYLPDHSWALYNEDGTIDIGVEAGFLSSINTITEIEVPVENDLIEQGYPGFKIKTGDEVHGVFMPLSGRVIEINENSIVEPQSLDSNKWLIKIIPSQLTEELKSLQRRPRC